MSIRIIIIADHCCCAIILYIFTIISEEHMKVSLHNTIAKYIICIVFLCYINQCLAHLPKERIWTRRHCNHTWYLDRLKEVPDLLYITIYCSCEIILMLITFTYKFIIMLICYVTIKLLRQTCLLISSIVAYTELQRTHLWMTSLGPVLTYISLLIIPCMIVYVTNNKEPWTLNLGPMCKLSL